MMSKTETGEHITSSPLTRIKIQNQIARWLDRIILGCVFLLAAAAPHSIAATQIAWGVGLFSYALRCALPPRPRLLRTPLDYALLTFFALSVLSSFLSYAPDISVGKLRAASLFTIAYLVAQNVRGRQTAVLLAYLLLVSCTVNVVYTIGQRVWGRGLKVQGVKAESPLRAAGLKDGDTVLKVDGAPVRGIEMLEKRLSGAATDPPAQLQIYRYEATLTLEAARGKLLGGDTPEARLGIDNWARGRDWRATGFYDHYTTYAEALQLIASLAGGLLIARRRKFSPANLLFAAVFVCFCVALFLTVTRASWLSFLLSLAVMMLLNGERRLLVALLLGAALAVPAGLFLLQTKRNVGFFDGKDPSVGYRLTVWREGARLIMSNPRHLAVGVGMDSIKRYWREWGLFDGGRLPLGHMHSTLLQIALERGLPTLIAWLALISLYARMLFNLLRKPHSGALERGERGILLGAAGGLAGFVSSGMVHYNLGDSEVAMVFYFIMGVTLVLARKRNHLFSPETQAGAAVYVSPEATQ